MKINYSKNLLVIGIIIVSILGRLIPHIPNITPLTSMCLFVGMNLSHRAAFLSLLATLLISDIGLSSFLFNYPIFGYWTLFTYTGFMTIVAVSFKLQRSWKFLPIYLLSSSFGFWIWTNFGTWLTSGLYPKTLSGLSVCYIAALPFLHNALLGDLLWGTVFFGVYANLKLCAASKSFSSFTSRVLSSVRQTLIR
jgi:hypothetical protein